MFGRRAVIALTLLAIHTHQASAAPSEAELAFKDFVVKYERKYYSQEEEARSFKIFEASFTHIKVTNAQARSFFLVINEFADQAPEEFNSTHFGMNVPSPPKMILGSIWKGLPHLGTDLYSGAELPTSVDWTTKGAVTPAKSQGACGSCWSFSTTGALEGAWQIATGNLISLSEQQLVDCSKDGNSGCQGGDMDSAFDYLKDHDTCLDSSYPYVAQNGPVCKENTTCKVGIPKGAITGFYDVPTDDTKALMEAVAKQPVSVAIEADQTTFQMYGGGVLTQECGSKLDHGVLLVGYGTENGTHYWKVKNSWGPTWGEKGYVRIERGLPKAGQCGIKSMSSYPEVKAPSPRPSLVSSPTPGPSPAPVPVPPSSECVDTDIFCKESVHRPSTDCVFLSQQCKKTCGCCSPKPPSWCVGADSDSSKTVIV